MLKLFYWLFSIKVSLCNCQAEHRKSGFGLAKNQYQIQKLGQLPTNIAETSGLARVKGKRTFWTHNDGGNAAELLEIDSTGQQISRLPLPHVPNNDWEDLAQDPSGNLYIADIGNNLNQRQDLKIFSINPNKPTQVDTITFGYADQHAFPPPVFDQNFDSEALVYYENQLYAFSKNRSPTRRHVKMYAIPARAGRYSVPPVDSVFIKTMVTSADLSPDQRTLALLTYGKVFLFDVSAGMNFRKPTACIKIGKAQAEAILFVNNTDFIFTNEYHRELFLVKKRSPKP